MLGYLASCPDWAVNVTRALALPLQVGVTALNVASERGHLQVVQELLAAGANTDIPDEVWAVRAVGAVQEGRCQAGCALCVPNVCSTSRIMGPHRLHALGTQGCGGPRWLCAGQCGGVREDRERCRKTKRPALPQAATTVLDRLYLAYASP